MKQRNQSSNLPRKALAARASCVVFGLVAFALSSCSVTHEDANMDGQNQSIDMCNEELFSEIQERFGVNLESDTQLATLLSDLDRLSADYVVVRQQYRLGECDRGGSSIHTGYVKLRAAEPFEGSSSDSLVRIQTLEAFIFLFNEKEDIVWVERQLTAFGP